MAKKGTGVKQAAEELGVSPKWIRERIAEGVVAPERAGTKRNSRFVLSVADLEALRSARDADPAAGGTAVLARINRLESDRTNLLAQVAWARAIAQEQQKALEREQQRSDQLAAELEAQRARIERLKALSVLDRVLGRHKDV
ncbi:MAG: hypothetical protein JW733_04520 [Coriobacteriia bacterium]|nr:hypothetical protein [Coriobacteriia bacterium]MBN2847289.1 hypothetical protein [Coriobacteriia bacterium]